MPSDEIKTIDPASLSPQTVSKIPVPNDQSKIPWLQRAFLLFNVRLVGHTVFSGKVDGLFLGSGLIVQASKTANQAQSTTTTYFLISGITDEDSGWITAYAGGNMPADRVLVTQKYAWYKTGGTMNISAARLGEQLNATSANIDITVVASSGNILVKVTTAAFGAGAFKGNVSCLAGSINPGMIIV